MKKIVVLSGAGISAESGISTFRDANGLWENHRIEDVASPEGFYNNPELVMEFYNLRRQQLRNVVPNEAHLILAELQVNYDVHIVTQNVDDLHERAGSKKVLHLHGELKKVRPVNDPYTIYTWEDDLHIGDTDHHNVQLRPHIVWFGEAVPEMENAIQIAQSADIFIVIGTSMQVYPASGLIHYTPDKCVRYVIDPNLSNTYTDDKNFFKTSATEGMKLLKERLISK